MKALGYAALTLLASADAGEWLGVALILALLLAAALVAFRTDKVCAVIRAARRPGRRQR